MFKLHESAFGDIIITINSTYLKVFVSHDSLSCLQDKYPDTVNKESRLPQEELFFLYKMEH